MLWLWPTYHGKFLVHDTDGDDDDDDGIVSIVFMSI